MLTILLQIVTVKEKVYQIKTLPLDRLEDLNFKDKFTNKTSQLKLLIILCGRLKKLKGSLLIGLVLLNL